jgi:archaellum component FlaC|tara:strand:- start:732 stop:932 length:201 start_codon:yes stop_codon:yes gene_type:complete
MSNTDLDIKIAHLESELKHVSQIREEISSKIEDLNSSDTKMIATTEAFEAQIKTLKELKASQPELI